MYTKSNVNRTGRSWPRDLPCDDDDDDQHVVSKHTKYLVSCQEFSKRRFLRAKSKQRKKKRRKTWSSKVSQNHGLLCCRRVDVIDVACRYSRVRSSWHWLGLRPNVWDCWGFGRPRRALQEFGSKIDTFAVGAVRLLAYLHSSSSSWAKRESTPKVVW